MVNKTINAVLTALHTEFGDSYSYYAEDTEQNLQTPCFNVGLIRPTSRGSSWRTYNRIMPIVIHYFPQNELRPKRECYEIAERALEAVETIIIDGVKVCGKDLEIQVVENVLEIFVTYDFWTQTQTFPNEPIEEFDHATKLE